MSYLQTNAIWKHQVNFQADKFFKGEIDSNSAGSVFGISYSNNKGNNSNNDSNIEYGKEKRINLNIYRLEKDETGISDTNNWMGGLVLYINRSLTTRFVYRELPDHNSC